MLGFEFSRRNALLWKKCVEAAYNYLLTASGGFERPSIWFATLFSLAHWAGELGKAEGLLSPMFVNDQLDVTDACDLAQWVCSRPWSIPVAMGASPLSLGSTSKGTGDGACRGAM